ncbi:MAG: DNA polymerase III subunit delta, partial [Nitrospiraceae bacterium]|nr:DNA polymerase III subunit delta [Nitrospiraceae bacterium]
MSYRNFLEEIKKGTPAAGYLLSASDPFLHSEAVSLIRERVPEGEREFNFQSFDLAAGKASEVPLDQILDVLNTVPFFPGRKVVVIENAQKLLKKDLKKLGQYFLRPSESSLPVLLHLGTVKKEMKEALTGVKQIPLDISEKEIPAWLNARARSRGIELSADAADYLVGTIGPDLGLLSSELDKFTLLGKAKVERDDIAEIVEGRRTYNAFALVDAIRAQDTEKTLRIYRVLRETEEPYSLLGALNWQYARHFEGKDSPAERRQIG